MNNSMTSLLTQTVAHSKGQKILKKKYVVLDSFKKRTLGQFCVLKIDQVFVFLEESRMPWFAFEIYWPLPGPKPTTSPLTEPRWALQPQSTQWFPWIGLFVVQALSLNPCRRPIEVLISLHPCGRLSKIPNSQMHKVEKWKFLRSAAWLKVRYPRKNIGIIYIAQNMCWFLS